MRNDKEKAIAIYTETDDGLFDELVIDVYNRDYRYISDCKKQDLGKSNEEGTEEFYVEADFFYAYFKLIERHYGGSYLSADDYIDEKQYVLEESKKPLILKEEIWRAIRWELSEKELDRIISFDYRYEDDDYYDFDLIIEKVHALMRGEKTIRYFTSWCVALMRCFMFNMKCKNSEVAAEFCDLGDFFDGVAFMDSTLEGEKKLKECRDVIAALKYHNHKIQDAKNKKRSDFLTNGVVTYVNFGFSLNDGREVLNRVCVVDKKRKVINYLFVPDFDYIEGINYTFLSEEEFDDLSSKYFRGYALDTSLTVDYAALCIGGENDNR